MTFIFYKLLFVRTNVLVSQFVMLPQFVIKISSLKAFQMQFRLHVACTIHLEHMIVGFEYLTNTGPALVWCWPNAWVKLLYFQLGHWVSSNFTNIVFSLAFDHMFTKVPKTQQLFNHWNRLSPPPPPPAHWKIKTFIMAVDIT